MDNATIWNTLEKITDLPTLPTVYVKVSELLQSKEASMENVSHAVELDPALSAGILRLVNSAFYGLRQKSNSISHAVMILGFNTVKNALVSVSVLDTLRLQNTFKDFDLNDFWRHAVSVACVGKHLAHHSRLVAPEDAFMAGLLHDTGKIIMLNHFPDMFSRVWKTMKDRQISFYDAEQEVADIDHVQIGAYLARKWQLPEAIIEAIAGHHYCLSSEASTGLVECVMIANTLANQDYRIDPDDFVFDGHIEKAIRPLLIGRDRWIDEAMADIDSACEFFLEGR